MSLRTSIVGNAKSHKSLLSPQTSRVMDRGETGPGSPELRRRPANDVKRRTQLSRQTLVRRRSGTESGQENARARDLAASTRVVVPMSPQTMVASSMRDVEQQLRADFLRTALSNFCAKSFYKSRNHNYLELRPLCSLPTSTLRSSRTVCGQSFLIEAESEYRFCSSK